MDSDRLWNTKKVNILSLFSTNESDINARIRAPKKIEIQASNDGTTFESLAVFDNILYTQANEQKDFKFDNEREYRYYRLNVDNKSSGSYVGVGKILYGYKKSLLTEIPSVSADNFIEYGADAIRDFDYILINKNYILQDDASKNSDGLWTTQLDRKPLSISFK
ncbi:hypothetical protein B1B04_24920 [Lysinibacillus sp. KCTC 33748]|uniref:hypothetical protein n=1 Tax=unclassified Lysinibacillus TaxID=2636778 RepID=UPI0009A7AC7B|nr:MULTISPECIES: hypothetical protein [unclassified Lysinibacillus]OXS65596.1 hypothetical protein B1B04_24920 [Lysinibacillus sp. KCTC 33748]SKC19499.1 hypothetical protein SAMN06295926_1445 [Lysinibacillus sp. AC-3]